MMVKQSKTYINIKKFLRGKFIAMKFYLRKQEKSQIATKSYEQKKEEQTKTQNQQKEILRIKTENKEIETEKIIFFKIS